MAISVAIKRAFTPGWRQTQNVQRETSTPDAAAKGVYQPTTISTAAILESANSTSASGPGQNRALDTSAAATVSRRITSATPAPRLGKAPKSRCILHSTNNRTCIDREVRTALGLQGNSPFV